MDFHFAKQFLRVLLPGAHAMQLAIGAAVLLTVASLHAQTVPVEQFG